MLFPPPSLDIAPLNIPSQTIPPEQLHFYSGTSPYPQPPPPTGTSSTVWFDTILSL